MKGKGVLPAACVSGQIAETSIALLNSIADLECLQRYLPIWRHRIALPKDFLVKATFSLDVSKYPKI